MKKRKIRHCVQHVEFNLICRQAGLPSRYKNKVFCFKKAGLFYRYINNVFSSISKKRGDPTAIKTMRFCGKCFVFNFMRAGRYYRYINYVFFFNFTKAGLSYRYINNAFCLQFQESRAILPLYKLWVLF